MFPSNLNKRSNFRNLAGIQDCDKLIEKELIEARIPIRSGYKNWKYIKPKRTENGCRILNNWYDGRIFHCKSEVYFHIMGKLDEFTFTRAWYYYMVDGSVPIEIAKKIYENPIGKKDVRAYGHCGCIEPKGKSVNSYHIDSQEGLNLFVEMIKKI